MDIHSLLEEKREEIKALAAHYGVRKLRVFGSAARGDTTSASDIDFLVELEPGRSVMDLGGLLMDLQDLLGCDVDVVTERSLRPRIREKVLNEARPL
ncbi:MAG: nucleotidyltransferase family protein [Anaerolineales bacterium]|nr:nucleotidyltransferase family protein [Anaerolineales bacterium]